jgi:uncharacterized protein with GYD domain
MFQGRFSAETLKRLLAKPEDRSKAAAKIAKASGGRLHRYFMSLGEYDFVSILELPDEAAASCAMAVAASGVTTHMATTRLLTPTEAMDSMAKAQSAAPSLPLPKGA